MYLFFDKIKKNHKLNENSEKVNNIIKKIIIIIVNLYIIKNI